MDYAVRFGMFHTILYEIDAVSYTHLDVYKRQPLGLMRDPEDKGHLILDPETAPMIRKIYDMALDGWPLIALSAVLLLIA